MLIIFWPHVFAMLIWNAASDIYRSLICQNQVTSPIPTVVQKLTLIFPIIFPYQFMGQIYEHKFHGVFYVDIKQVTHANHHLNNASLQLHS